MKKGVSGIISIILIIIGISMLIGLFFDISVGREFWRALRIWWPAIIIFFGIAQLTNGKDKITSGLIITSIGIALLLDNLGLVPGFWSVLIPLLLISGGIHLALDKSKSPRSKSYNNDNNDEYSNPETDYETQRSNAKTFNHDINSIFASTEKSIADSNFHYASISSVFGSSQIDLRDCIAGAKHVELGLRSVLGSIELVIPSNWRLVTSGNPILGNFEDRTRGSSHPDTDIVECIVKMECILGNIEIRD